jgi:membrane-associated phospholipid phosphatase
MCLSTVYIRAHYAIDVFAGIVFGLVFYLLLLHLPIGKNKIF